jgi:hypothetical protein
MYPKPPWFFLDLLSFLSIILDEKYLYLSFFQPKIIMKNIYPTKLVHKLTGATINQLKYWVRINLIFPERVGKTHFYSFKDIIKLKLIVLFEIIRLQSIDNALPISKYAINQ